MTKGTCHLCGESRWLRGKGGACKPCAYPRGSCVRCRKVRKIYVDELCYLCYQDRQVRTALLNSEQELLPTGDYERYLFHLYLAYIRRYWLKYAHLNQARRLSKIFSTHRIALVLSWMNIYEVAKKHPLPHRSPSPKGCAWIKIGYMLQELGVLPPRTEEVGRHLESFRALLHPKNWARIELFLSCLRKLGNTESSLTRYLDVFKNLEQYLVLSVHGEPDLLTLNEDQMKRYLVHLHQSKKVSSAYYLRGTRDRLSRFYRFCKDQKWIILNPCENIKLSRELGKLTICSPEQIREIERFIKSPASPPESALIICLILFFGFTIEDLAFATMEIKDSDFLVIALRRKARSRGRHYYNRDQTLELPTHSKWFLGLQKRYYQAWSVHYSRVKRTYPHYPLILFRDNRANRPLSAERIRLRVQEATQAATGIVIPASVLRQTCGHLHSSRHDASLLSRLGWSPQFAFNYTWLPRTYFIPNKPARQEPSRTGELEGL